MASPTPDQSSVSNVGEAITEKQDLDKISLDSARRPVTTGDAVVPPEKVQVSKMPSQEETQDIEDVPPESPPPIYSVFRARTKALIIVFAAFGSVFSPLSSQIYLPTLSTLADQYQVSVADINLTITSYMILQGIAPMFFGDLADQMGRRPTYIACFIIYFFANLGLALQRNYAALIVLRALQSSGSSGTIALGNGVVADITTSAERGSYIAWVQLGTQLGPALGPTLGGILAQFLGWSSIFWFLLIGGGIYLVLYAILIPETSRNIVADGSLPPQRWNRSLLNVLEDRKQRSNSLERTHSREAALARSSYLAKSRKCRLPNPLRALRVIVEKDVSLVLFSLSLTMTGFFCLIVPMPDLFARKYSFNNLQIGLCYIPFSAGAMIGSILCGRFLDYNFRRVARAQGFPIDRKRAADLRNFPIEIARLQVVMGPLLIGAASVLVWGWVLSQKTTLAAPLIVLFIGGFMLSGAMSMLNSLLVDLYPASPATATAALNLCRCSMGAVGTAVIDYIIAAWGLGWTYTFLGLLMACTAPMLWCVTKWGPQWREERFLRLEQQAQTKRNREDENRADQDKNPGVSMSPALEKRSSAV
ncbi:major facilitator superfamily transporter [Phyllosticta citricarpa]|uniref:Major facilitator superfamily transporter n=2 Tax=Phyllosticta TaxID=121621 RepID=A0ABR1L5E9_9PEZI